MNTVAARGTNPLRAERWAELVALREAGCTISEAASAMGISQGYVRDLVNDPDGSKGRARKASYAGVCSQCGGPTNGSNGPRKAATVCGRCAAALQHENRRWTRETCIDALQRFARAHGGRPPTANEWRLADHENDYPAASTVHSAPSAPFRSWNEAIVAAGLRPRRVVRHKRGRAGATWTREEALREIRAYEAREGKPPSGADCNRDDRLPCTPQLYRLFGGVPAAVRAAGFEPRFERSDEPVSRLYDPPLELVPEPEPVEPEPLPVLELPEPDDRPGLGTRLLRRAQAFRDDSGALEDEIGLAGANARPAPSLARVTLSRGAKILRVARAMCELRGDSWWEVEPAKRRAYVTLASLAVDAVEVVEADELALAEDRRRQPHHLRERRTG